jgi:hypothetical protein
MSRNLIGSYNVYRTNNRYEFSEHPKFKMVKCTNKEVLAVTLKKIDKERRSHCLIIKNLQCEAVHEIADTLLWRTPSRSTWKW